MTPSRTGKFSVKLSFSRSTGTEGSSSSQAAARPSALSASVGIQAVGINSACPDGQIDHPSRNGTCVLSESELLKDKGIQGRFHVTPGLLDGVTRVAAASLSDATDDCAGLTAGRLASWMIAIGFWETTSPATATECLRDSKGNLVLDRTTGQQIVLYQPGDNRRSPSRSLMTLSRKDRESVLYPPGRAADERAFWHPGVGYWQLDLWPVTQSMNHYQRADVLQGGRAVADVLRDAYCTPTDANEGTKDGFTTSERERSVRAQLDGRERDFMDEKQPGGWLGGC